MAVGLLKYNDKLRKEGWKRYNKVFYDLSDFANKKIPLVKRSKNNDGFSLIKFTHNLDTEYGKFIHNRYVNNTDDTTNYYGLIEDEIIEVQDWIGRYENYIDYISAVYGDTNAEAKATAELFFNTVGGNTLSPNDNTGLNDVGVVTNINAFTNGVIPTATVDEIEDFINYKDSISGTDTVMGKFARRAASKEYDLIKNSRYYTENFTDNPVYAYLNTYDAYKPTDIEEIADSYSFSPQTSNINAFSNLSKILVYGEKKRKVYKKENSKIDSLIPKDVKKERAEKAANIERVTYDINYWETPIEANTKNNVEKVGEVIKYVENYKPEFKSEIDSLIPKEDKSKVSIEVNRRKNAESVKEVLKFINKKRGEANSKLYERLTINYRANLKTQAQKLRSKFHDKGVDNGGKYLTKNSVLQGNGAVNIAPATQDVGHTMFSIENLAWKDVLKVDDERDISKSQRGPNGGRIMWFAPYNLKFQENVSVNWNENSFIGRGENVYTYTNTMRGAQLSFTMIIDTSSQYMNLINHTVAKDKDSEEDMNEQLEVYLDETIDDAKIVELFPSLENENDKMAALKNQLKETIRTYYAKKQNFRYDNEYEFFEEQKGCIVDIIKDFENKNTNDREKKYFEASAHSTTPEGFSARLTFLQQCTRQGHTISSSEADKEQTTSAANLAFGRMPVIVLRIGDFINTRAIIESLSIDYADSQWDLNVEGCGVQPLQANISLGLKLLGGQTMEAPVSRLQNAVSFNYYANTGVYDDRADRVAFADGQNGDDRLNYQYLYNINEGFQTNTKTGVYESVYFESDEEIQQTLFRYHYLPVVNEDV